MHQTPITVITGYLGAGKTTLLRKLLQYGQKEKLRLAVVMNEFGQEGIDGKLVRGKNLQMVELSGGCVCCSMSGEFEAALKELVSKAKPHYIVIETTGVAEPDAIVVDLKGLPGVRLDAVVTVADADALSRFPNLGSTGRVQLEMADLVLLNKNDLIGKKELEIVEKNIRELNSRATIVACVKCSVPAEMVLGLDAKPRQVAHREHSHEQNEFFLLEPKTLLAKKFEEFASKLPKKVYRAKGFVKLVKKKGDKPIVYLWNFVAGRSSLEKWAENAGKLVFIGEGIAKFEKKVAKEITRCELK